MTEAHRDEPALREPVKTPVDSRQAKLAGSVAERIISDIAAMGWPVGVVIGSETELVERYGVSRAVFREAVRLVEHHHVARMRRGPGGGLMVDELNVEAVISAALIYLLRVDARLDEVFDARVVLEEIVAETVPGRISESDLAAVREVLSAEASTQPIDHRRLHQVLAAATNNPVLELFVDCLNRVAGLYFTDRSALSPETLSESLRAHRSIAGAVLDNDPELARRRMRHHLNAEAEYIRRHRNSVQMLSPSVVLAKTLGSKRAEVLASAICAQVLEAGLVPGDFIGTEAELMSRHSSSRAVFREAIRILEHQDVVRMRRGPRGGLFVTAPSAVAVAEIVAIYLRRKQVSAEQLLEARLGVELALLQRADANMDAADKNTLRQALAEQADPDRAPATDGSDNLHLMLASMSGNRVLELVAFVLLRLAYSDFSGRFPNGIRRPALQDIHEAHQAIGDALLAGDREGAANLMRDHLGPTP